MVCTFSLNAFLCIGAGGENGFNQAIELSSDTLANVKFVMEKRLISKFFDELAQDTGKIVMGVKDTLACLDMGAVETLIVWENLDMNRLELRDSLSGEIVVKMLSSVQVSPDAVTPPPPHTPSPQAPAMQTSVLISCIRLK